MMQTIFGSTRRRIGFLSVLLLVNSLGIQLRTLSWAQPAQAAVNDLIVYDNALAANWQDWSWSSTNNFANATPTHAGAAAIAVTYSQAWAGLSLRAPSALNASLYSAITFWVHGGNSGTRQLNFYIQQTDNGGNSTLVSFDALAGQWTQFSMSLSALGNPSAIARINIQDRSGATQPAFYVDDMVLVGAVPSTLTGTIQVNTAGTPIAVDSRIFGTNLPAWLNPNNLANVTLRARTSASGVSVLRMPGGSWSNTYGWLSCEMGANQVNALPCGSGWESWAAKPTDFINFLKATGKQGM